MKIFYLFIMLSFSSCYSQNEVSLTFINKSPLAVDSIVIQSDKKVILGQLKAGEKYSKEFSHIEINSNREGDFYFLVFINGRSFYGHWGFHDYGHLSQKKEFFYIFENGIAYTNKALEKPKDFNLFFYNTSQKKIDSIYSNTNSILKVDEWSPRQMRVIYDYTKIEKNPFFIVKMDGDTFSIKIDYHDFGNWNNSQDFVYFENDKLHSGHLGWREPLEFIVDLEIKTQTPIDSIKFESSAITKIYNNQQPKSAKIVFDFKKLKANPIFYVIEGKKKYKVDLSSHDFSNIYANQKTMFLEESGIRSLTD